MKTRFSRLKGLIPPMVTPLIDNNTLDRDGTVRLVEHMIAGGVHGNLHPRNDRRGAKVWPITCVMNLPSWFVRQLRAAFPFGSA